MNLNRRTIAAALLVLPVLAGCLSTTSVRRDVRPELKETGLLLLPVTDRALFTATGVVLFFVDEKGTRSWARVNGYETPIPASDGRGSRFYAAVELPAGNYRFTSWSLIKTEGAAAKEPKEPLAFSISNGEVLYVGNFNVIRFRATGQFRDRYAEDVLAFKKWYPWLEGMDIKSRPLPPTVWGTPDSEEGKSTTPR
jgi:hypothetical protein